MLLCADFSFVLECEVDMISVVDRGVFDKDVPVINGKQLLKKNNWAQLKKLIFSKKLYPY